MVLLLINAFAIILVVVFSAPEGTRGEPPALLSAIPAAGAGAAAPDVAGTEPGQTAGVPTEASGSQATGDPLRPGAAAEVGPSDGRDGDEPIVGARAAGDAARLPVSGVVVPCGADAFRGTEEGAASCPASAEVGSEPAVLIIYEDALAPGWVDLSWEMAVGMAVESPRFSGSSALAAQVIGTWGGLYLRAPVPIDLTPFQALHFYARATEPDQQYWVYLVDEQGDKLGTPVVLSEFSGPPPVDDWTEYVIPLDASYLNVARALASGIVIQDYVGRNQPPLYLDQIRFVGVKPVEASGTSQRGALTIVAAGDIACAPDTEKTLRSCHQEETASLVEALQPAAVIALGDIQSEGGEYQNFLTAYDPSWGRFKAITYPVVGNHDYGDSGATGYFAYFGERAGDPDKGFYSFDLGGWHIVVLNSQCGQIGGCGVSSLQYQWLRADLLASDASCTLVSAHVPRFNSGQFGDFPKLEPLWELLYEFGADVALAGHAHDYERLIRMTPDGRPDPEYGIRQFVIGTGGRSFQAAEPGARTEALFVGFGVLELTLEDGAYSWRFIDEEGVTQDSGQTACHLAPDLSDSPA